MQLVRVELAGDGGLPPCPNRVAGVLVRSVALVDEVRRARRGCEMDVEDARTNVAAIYELGERGRRLLLVDMRGMRSQTREAREYLAVR